MPGRDEPSEVDRLLGEVDRMISGAPAVPPQREVDHPAGGLRGRVRSAAVTGAVAGGAVWVLFALLPFLRATSGGLGAFLATFVVVLLLRRR